MVVKTIFFFMSTLLLCQGSMLGPWKWTGKVAVVTGASSGIGEEIAVQLADKGMIVAALARRTQRLEEVVRRTTGKIFPITCDLTDEKDINKAFRWIETTLGGVDVLVNNAGVFFSAGLTNGDTRDWNAMFDVNVLGLAICTREALKTMRTRGDNGQIININSVVGHQVFYVKNVINGVYTASKYAVTAMSEALSNELYDAGSRIKVTNLSPGLVKTEFVTNATISSPEFKDYLNSVEHVGVDDIAHGVLYVLSTNPNAQIAELTIKQMGPM